MTLVGLEKHQNITEMRKRTVLCSEESKVGRIIDVVFDAEYGLRSFIIGGDFWEEFREALGVIDDIDPVIPIENISEITEKEIKLNVPRGELKHKLEEGVIPPTALTYNNLRRKKVIDANGNKIGKIVNMVFLPCGEASFILGGPMLEELAEAMGLRTNWDLLLPVKYIEAITEETIKITAKQDTLEATLNNHLLDDKAAKEYLDSIKLKGGAELRAITRVSVGVTDFSRKTP